MLDEYFKELEDKINFLIIEFSSLRNQIQPTQELYDIKTMARISGIPYNTLLNKKSLLPKIELSVKIGTKHYYPKKIFFEWLDKLKNSSVH